MRAFRIPVYINVLGISPDHARDHLENELIWLGLQRDNRVCDFSFIPDTGVVVIPAADSEGGDID
jgi:hypothetical protein